MKHTISIVGIAALALALTACSGGGTDAATSTSRAASKAPASSSAPTTSKAPVAETTAAETTQPADTDADFADPAVVKFPGTFGGTTWDEENENAIRVIRAEAPATAPAPIAALQKAAGEKGWTYIKVAVDNRKGDGRVDINTATIIDKAGKTYEYATVGDVSAEWDTLDAPAETINAARDASNASVKQGAIGTVWLASKDGLPKVGETFTVEPAYVSAVPAYMSSVSKASDPDYFFTDPNEK